MNLEAVYFISQIVAATALVLSLVFVGLQVRQGNRLAQVGAEQTRQANDLARDAANRHILEQSREWHKHLVRDRETFEAIILCMKEYDTRNNYTKAKFAIWLWDMTNLIEQIYFQDESQRVDTEALNGFFYGYATITNSPGGMQWFAETKHVMTARVCQHIEELHKAPDLGDPREVWKYFDVDAPNHSMPVSIFEKLHGSKTK